MKWQARHRLISMALGAVVAVVLALTSFPSVVEAGMQVSVNRTVTSISADSHISQKSGETTNNYGTATNVTVESFTTANRNRRAIVYFVFPWIASNSTVLSANLTLYAETVPAVTRTYNAHRVTTNWTEANVTWVTANATGNWLTAGGDYISTPTASNTTPASAGVRMWWNVTSDISGFLAGTYTNKGWLVKDSAEGSGTSYVSLLTAREGAAANHPQLKIRFVASWDSHTDSARAGDAEDSFYDTLDTVYMLGKGFAQGNYNIYYYDGGVSGGKQVLVATQTNVPVGADGILLNLLGYNLRSDQSATQGVWHVLVQPAGATAMPTYYNDAIADPDGYEIIANDSFNVDLSAIPEFPTVIPAIGAAALCFAVYYWMRKRVYGVQSYRVYRVCGVYRVQTHPTQ